MTTDFLQPFRPDELSVASNDHWIAVVRIKQITVGSCVLLLKRYEEDATALTAPEATSFFDLARQVREAQNAVFHPQKTNIIASMMRVKSVHYHVIPRYDHPVQFADQWWFDQYWPKVASFGQITPPDSYLLAVRDALRVHMN